MDAKAIAERIQALLDADAGALEQFQESPDADELLSRGERLGALRDGLHAILRDCA